MLWGPQRVLGRTGLVLAWGDQGGGWGGGARVPGRTGLGSARFARAWVGTVVVGGGGKALGSLAHIVPSSWAPGLYLYARNITVLHFS